MRSIKIFTDGGCSGNPGPGSHGWVVIHNHEILHYYMSDVEPETTNNRQELKAMLEVLEYVFEVTSAPDNEDNYVIYCDSAYVVNTCTTWIWTWAMNGWLNSKKQIVENVDLMEQLYDVLNKLNIYSYEIVKVKGHAGNAGNELADALATRNLTKFDKIVEKYELKKNN